jgi:hypothetical protein
MLCDDIINDKELPGIYPGFSTVQGLIKKSNKYVLSPDFTAAADGLVNNFPQLRRIAPFCRLPAPTCWFELAQSDRPHFLEAPMDFTYFQSKPKRVGFLCIAEPDKLWRWYTILCWSLTETKFGSGPLNSSMIIIHFDTKDGYDCTMGDLLADRVKIGVAPFCPPYMANQFFESSREMIRLMASDWGGEIRYLISLLGLLNARNVAESASVDRSKLNRKRIADRKPPFCNHTLLKIRAMHRRSLIGARGAGTSEDVREHFVSGHWKARRTGLFWWNPFWRGNPEQGKVSHDYQIGL